MYSFFVWLLLHPVLCINRCTVCVYECFVLSVCVCVHLFIKYFLFYCTSGRLSLLWCSCGYFFIICASTPSLSLPICTCLHGLVLPCSRAWCCPGMGLLFQAASPLQFPVSGPSRPTCPWFNSALPSTPSGQSVTNTALALAAHPSLSLSFSYPLSPLLSSPVLSSPWPRLSSLISIIKQKLVNVSDARWLRHPATGPLAQHERTHKHLTKTHTHSLMLSYSHLHTHCQIQHICESECSEWINFILIKKLLMVKYYSLV